MKFVFFKLEGKILSNNLNNCIYDLSFIRKMDKKCLELFFNKRGIEIKKVINNLFFINYLTYRYMDSRDFIFTLKRIKRNIEFIPVCPTCKNNYLSFIGKPSKMFASYCSCKCAGKNVQTIKKKKDTQIKNWGTECCYNSSIYKERLLREKGIEYWTQDKTIIEKRKETLLKHYGTLNISNVLEVKEKIKRTCNERYGADSPMQNEDIKKKYNNSIRKNNYKKSINEDILFQYLNILFPNDIERQYSSNVYPYKCDFYITSKHIYIEYNGSHYHHYHPFNKWDKKDIEELERLKIKSKEKHQFSNKKNQYDMIIYTWTELDVKKRDIAKNNNLKYLVYYKLPTIEELKNDIKMYE